MASLPESVTQDDQCTCTVEASPDEVDAGADFTLKVLATCPRKHSLREPVASIRGCDDVEIVRAGLKKSDDADYETDDIVLVAPRIVGEHAYRAVVLTVDKGGAWREQASTTFRFVVRPHVAELNVWDVPSAVVPGERFAFITGFRCSAGCNLAGHTVRIVDRDGAPVACASLGDDVWPGTDALYFAEVSIIAPPTTATHQWELRTAAWDADLPHAAGSFPFAVKVVSPPDCEVTVEAFDRETQTPIKGARVVMHPYRATTDENGVAKVKVGKGCYDILVSASKYAPVSTTVEVTADMITRAELDGEPPWDPLDEI